jgi:HEAT repeat protein
VSTWLGLEPGEGPRTARLFSFIFLLTSAAVAARSAQRELFLAAFSRAAIPDAFLLSSMLLVAASLGISAWAERSSPLRLMRWLLVAGVATLAGAFALALAWPAQGPMLIFVAVEVLLSILLGQAWAVVGEAVDVRAAKRLFPVIGLGAGLAWTLGGFAVSAVARLLGPASLLLLGGGGLVGALAALEVVATRDITHDAPPPRSSKGFFAGVASGLGYIASEPLTRVLALIVTGELVVEKVTDFQLFALAQQRFAGQSGELAAFMGLFFGVTGALSLVSPLVAGRVLAAFGSTRALVAGQAWLLVGSLAFLVFPGFAVVVLLTGGDRWLKQSLTSPARSQIFGALPAARRSQAGALLRGVLAACFGALASLGLKAVPADFPVHWLSAAVMVLVAGLLWATASSLRTAYLAALQSSVDGTRLDLDGHEAKRALPREQLVLLEEELRSGDEGRGLLAVSVLAASETAPARDALVKALEHPAAAVRSLAALTLGRTGDARHAADLVRTLATSTEPDVRGACLEGLAELGDGAVLQAIEAHVEANAVQVRALARVARLRIQERLGLPATVAPVEALFTSSDAAERAAAAWAIGRIPVRTGDLEARFAPLLADAEPEVRKAALSASAQFADEGILRQLVSALDEPGTAPVAFEALTRVEDDVVDEVEKVLDGAAPELLSRAAGALAQQRGERATDVLQKWLEHDAPQVRYRASRALVQRRRAPGWRPPGEAALLRFIETELALGYRYLAALTALADQVRAGDPALRFLAGEIESRTQETERRLLALVGVVADPRLARLSHHLHSASPQVTAKVLELIEQSLDPRLSTLLVPFLERKSAAEKVRAGAQRFGVATTLADAPLEAVLALKDEHLKLVAHVAFQGRAGAALPELTKEEETQVRLVERVRFLRSVPVFKDLSPEDLMKLAEIASSSEHRDGTVVFRMGDPGDVLCVVVSGKVEIRNGEQLIATQGPNDFFGELALFDQEPRSADAVCVADTVLLEIGGADLEALMERRPEIAREIIRVLARRLREHPPDRGRVSV